MAKHFNFYVDDKSIDSAHVKFLEHYAIKELKALERPIKNKYPPSEPTLAADKREDSLAFFDHVTFFCSLMGYPIFEASELASQPTPELIPESTPTLAPKTTLLPPKELDDYEIITEKAKNDTYQFFNLDKDKIEKIPTNQIRVILREGGFEEGRVYNYEEIENHLQRVKDSGAWVNPRNSNEPYDQEPIVVWDWYAYRKPKMQELGFLRIYKPPKTTV
ncbi:MAG: hypothetical protein GDA50_00025 [Alphaproteobacteria bacterium GM202ARS2]|nr:hypothetical protein [Alphaproteobacteria bacterium GM202ARS2]